ncbi:MAG: hypothetical protein ACI8R8_000998 [Paraglaciecola sp.]|jgi:hypothetical protein
MSTISFFTLKAVGKLTHEVYLIITPMLDSALSEVKEPNVNAIIDCIELQGWEERLGMA